LQKHKGKQNQQINKKYLGLLSTWANIQNFKQFFILLTLVGLK
jgi:hypothetical protein